MEREDEKARPNETPKKRKRSRETMVTRSGTLAIRERKDEYRSKEGIEARAVEACFKMERDTFIELPIAIITKKRITVKAVMTYAAMAQ